MEFEPLTPFFGGGIAISNQMALTGVTHTSSYDVTDREGKLRTNEFRPLTPCLGVIATSNQMVIIHSLFGQRESPTFDHMSCVTEAASFPCELA